MLKPKAKFNKITDIDIEFFKKNNIKAVILDVDNTLIDIDKKPLENIENWVQNVKNENIKLCIASNSIDKQKIKNVAQKLDIPYFYRSCKPFKVGLKKAQNLLNERPEHIAEIGDQLFADALGANRMKMFSILTIPISEEKNILGKIRSKIEKKLLKKL